MKIIPSENKILWCKFFFIYQKMRNWKRKFWKYKKRKPSESALEVFSEKSIFKNFPKFTGKHLCWSLFLIKLQSRGLTPIEPITKPSTITRPEKEEIIYRSSRPEVFCKKGVLRNFVKFAGKHLCQSLSFNKVALVFSREFYNISKNFFFIEHLWWQLLNRKTNLKV